MLGMYPSSVCSRCTANSSPSAQELETIMKDQTVSDARKQQKTTSMRRSEANFLRFLRTSERPQNYTTLKIIGKGAFGEVKLVQRKHDGKIYALKSLVKAEMVCCAHRSKLYSTLVLTQFCSSRRTNSPTSAPSVTFSPMPTVPGSSSYTLRSKIRPSSTCSWSSCRVVT